MLHSRPCHARCRPIGLKTSSSNTARWISAGVHNFRPGVCLRKAPHRNCGPHGVGRKKSQWRATDNMRFCLLTNSRSNRTHFYSKHLHTGRSNHIGKQQQLSKPQKHKQWQTFLRLCHKQEKVVRRCPDYCIYCVSAENTHLHPADGTACITMWLCCRCNKKKVAGWDRSVKRNTTYCSLHESDQRKPIMMKVLGRCSRQKTGKLTLVCSYHVSVDKSDDLHLLICMQELQL